MKHRFAIPVVVAVLAFGGMAACGKGEPEGPTPEELAQMRQDSIEAARQDSIRRAEAARRDSLQAQREAEAALRTETEAARAILQEMIHFGYDRSELTREAQDRLMRKLRVMRANPEVRLRIAGHADERGSIEYNRALGQRRAEAAREFLVSRGIDGARLTTVSFGEDRPLVNASNEAAWAENRRDEFTVIFGGDQLRNPSGP